MLVINRNPGESIMIGDNFLITVLEIQGKTIQFGFEDLANKRILANLSARFNQKIQMGNEVSILVIRSEVNRFA